MTTSSLTGVVDRTVALSSTIDGWIAPRVTALRFVNAVDSFVNVGSDAALDDLMLGDFTFELWMKMTSAPAVAGGSYMWSGLQTDATGYMLRFFPSGGKAFGSVGGYAAGGYWQDSHTWSSQELLDGFIGSWHHVAYAWENSVFPSRMWVDGIVQTKNPTTPPSGAHVSEAANDKFIGNRSDGARAFIGDLAWVRLSSGFRYTEAFTPPSINDPPLIDSDTTEQWNFLEGEGSTAGAEVDSANDGTIGAGCSWVAI